MCLPAIRGFEICLTSCQTSAHRPTEAASKIPSIGPAMLSLAERTISITAKLRLPVLRTGIASRSAKLLVNAVIGHVPESLYVGRFADTEFRR